MDSLLGRALTADRRVQALAKYAFGLGLLQMVITTAAFTVFSLPVGHGVGTIILEKVRSRNALKPKAPRPKVLSGVGTVILENVCSCRDLYP